MLNRTTASILSWLITLAMPFFLGFAVLTYLVGPFYPTYEYGKADFPPDAYGFSQEERLDLAMVAVNYLESWQAPEEVIYMLEEQVIPGTNEPLYLESEVGHMLDVKVLTDWLRIIAWISGIIVIGGLALLLASPKTRPIAYVSLRGGGYFTTGVLIVIALFILLAWSTFFVQFHELLFPPGTWTFSYQDSLIRLFPERFWFDFGVLASGSVLLLGILVAIVGYFLARRHPVEPLA